MSQGDDAVETASLPSTATGGQPKTLLNHNKVTTKVDPITALQESIGKKLLLMVLCA
jgi:hypothetical protein